MSTGITTSFCVVEGYRDSDQNHALARIDQCMSGCAHQIRLVNMGTCGAYWLCARADDPQNDYILLLPSARWEQDARDAGFVLVKKLNQRES